VKRKLNRQEPRKKILDLARLLKFNSSEEFILFLKTEKICEVGEGDFVIMKDCKEGLASNKLVLNAIH
jgi:hypothetical protein